jgi:fatty acid desaturase
MSWVIGVCGIPLWEYLLLFVYPGTSLTLLRSFAEHRSHPDWEGRSAILEAEYLFGILYLYNNFHALHHNNPYVPWYKLPSLFRQEREKLLERNNNYLICGYSELFLKYLISPKEIPYLLNR